VILEISKFMEVAEEVMEVQEEDGIRKSW